MGTGNGQVTTVLPMKEPDRPVNIEADRINIFRQIDVSTLENPTEIGEIYMLIAFDRVKSAAFTLHPHILAAGCSHFQVLSQRFLKGFFHDVAGHVH
jgi:hypothetical protein